jgi:hypothetical protein
MGNAADIRWALDRDAEQLAPLTREEREELQALWARTCSAEGLGGPGRRRYMELRRRAGFRIERRTELGNIIGGLSYFGQCRPCGTQFGIRTVVAEVRHDYSGQTEILCTRCADRDAVRS